jgi:hypothetical protein
MDVWGWIAVYAVGLTVLQLLVYRYLLNSGGSLRRRVGTPFGDGESDGDDPWGRGRSGSPDPPGSRGTRPDQDGPPPRDAEPTRGVDAWERRAAPGAGRRPGEGDGRTCPHCGTVNERDDTFSRCWNCAREL